MPPGVMLGEFCDQAAIQHDLFTDHTAPLK